jgi:hypothetical protein
MIKAKQALLIGRKIERAALRVSSERNEPNDERTIAGHPFHGLVRIRLAGERLAQQSGIRFLPWLINQRLKLGRSRFAFCRSLVA